MIRPATEDDIDFVYNLYMHPLVNPFLMYEQMDKETFGPIFNDLLQKKIKYIYAPNDEPAGMFKLVPNVYRSHHVAYLGGVAVHPSSTGKGHGAIMMQQILAFAQQQGFLRIELSVAVTNEKAIRLYEKTGFIKEGVLHNYTHLASEKKLIDEVMMAYLFTAVQL